MKWAFIILTTLLVGCTDSFMFNEVKKSCTPPPSSARFSGGPGPVIKYPLPKQSANGTVKVSGTCLSGFDVEISGSGIVQPVTTPCKNGQFETSIQFSSGDGLKDLIATQKEIAKGNDVSDRICLIQDTIPPKVEIIAAPGNGAQAVNTPSTTVSGICESGLEVIIEGPGIKEPVTTQCVNGRFQAPVQFTAPDGIKNIVARQEDPAGNKGNDQKDFLKDTTPPLVKIETPAPMTLSQGSIQLEGSCENGVPVIVSGNGVKSPVRGSCQAGRFSFNITLSSKDGKKLVTVTQTDLAGNKGSDSRTFVKDATPPLLSIDRPESNSYVTQTITLEGKCESSLPVQISGGQNPLSVNCQNGKYSTPLQLRAQEGTHTITVTQKDFAGNIARVQRSFLRDTLSPVVSITSPAANTVAVRGVQLKGNCEANLKVHFRGDVIKTSTSCQKGTFSTFVTFKGNDGPKKVTAFQEDPAGNVGSSTRTFIKDSSRPSLTIQTPKANSYVKQSTLISGSCETNLPVLISGDIRKNQRVKCISSSYTAQVELSSPEGPKVLRVKQTDMAGNTSVVRRLVIKDTTPPLVTIDSPKGSSVHKGQLTLEGKCETGLELDLKGSDIISPFSAFCKNGQYAVKIQLSAGDGQKTIRISQTDKAGNTGMASQVFINDLGAPVIKITSPAANTRATNGLRLQGICEAGLTVYLGGSGLQAPSSTNCPSGSFDVNITFSPGDGNKTITVSQKDLAGNTGSDSRVFIKDTSAPLVKITAPPAGTAAQTGVLLQGTCESDLLVQVSGDLSNPGSTPCNQNQFSYNVTFSAGLGMKSITVSQTDALGNQGRDSRSFTKDNLKGYESFISEGANRKVDILFVDDNSGSMEFEQAALSRKFSSFSNSLTSLDWQIGITTTDVSDGPFGIKGSLLPFAGTGSYILKPTTPQFEKAFQDTIQRPETVNCVGSGSCPSGKEMPLLASILAIDKRNTDNAGFFRPDANLAIVILSDEDEDSTGPSTATQPQEVVDKVKATFPNKKLSVYGIIVQPGDSQCKAIQDAQVPGIQSHYGTFVQKLADITGGVTMSVCEPDYSITLQNIANSVIGLGNSVQLKQVPLPGTVQVSFTPAFNTSWTVSGNRVIFQKAPPKGTRIEVFYQY
ncbi:MAG: hypothetical protein D6797_06350 [Bdellovibrio sp.]|nr:MAG: hypothetical protein D6797_06350 [Bdellovibrio sp.]